MSDYFNIIDSNFFGALTGAGITGLITIIIFYIDKRSLRKERESEKNEMKEKNKLFFITNCKLIIDNLNSIIFFADLLERNNRYNVDPLKEIHKKIKELSKFGSSLINVDLELVPIELYENASEIMEHVKSISNTFEAVLATEDEEALQNFRAIKVKSNQLINFIQSNILVLKEKS